MVRYSRNHESMERRHGTATESNVEVTGEMAFQDGEAELELLVFEEAPVVGWEEAEVVEVEALDQEAIRFDRKSTDS